MQLLFLILSLLTDPVEKCNSTIFGHPGDKLAGGRARYLGRPVDPDRDLGIASRNLPLGSVVVLYLPPSRKTPDGSWAAGVVLDRGPYGRIDAKGEWLNGAKEYRRCNAKYRKCLQRKKPGERCVPPLHRSCYSKGSRWNGCADITPRLGAQLSHDGWARIHVYSIPRLRIPRKLLLLWWGGHGDV